MIDIRIITELTRLTKLCIFFKIPKEKTARFRKLNSALRLPLLTF